MTINFEDFQKLDIRIGTVISAEIPEWSHWVMKLTVDFGSPPEGLGEKTIFAGLMGHFEPKEIEGKQFPFIVNLEPRKMGPKGDISEGMMMAASVPIKNEKEDEKPVLFNLSEKVPNGTKVR